MSTHGMWVHCPLCSSDHLSQSNFATSRERNHVLKISTWIQPM